jgi:hypothetical protein
MIKYVNAFASVEPNPKKEPIRLNYGDPTIAGNLLPAEAVVQALHVAIDEHRFDGYGASGLLKYKLFVLFQFMNPMKKKFL